MKYVLRVKDIKNKNFFNIATGNSDVARRHDEFFVSFVKIIGFLFKIVFAKYNSHYFCSGK